MSRLFWRTFLDAFTFNTVTISGDKMRQWRALAEQSQTVTDGPWFVTKEDLVGGWCVRTINEPPSSGRGITIADFIREEDARLCATARNLQGRNHEADAGLRAATTDRLAIAENGQLYLKPPRRLTLVYGEQTGKINVAVSPEPLACVLTPLAYQLSGGASVLP